MLVVAGLKASELKVSDHHDSGSSSTSDQELAQIGERRNACLSVLTFISADSCLLAGLYELATPALLHHQ
jgi:hypothetical protein